MKKRVRKKIPKFNSKKGMSLVELIVGITILVIVFTSTLSAMTNGYTDTLFNANANISAVEGGSLNEIIMQTAAKQGFNSGACEAYFTAHDPNSTVAVSSGSIDNSNAIHEAAKVLVPDIQYVPYTDEKSFPLTGNDASENQYTINFNASSVIKKNGAKDRTIKGFEIITMVTSVKGTIINRSFVPYTDQT